MQSSHLWLGVGQDDLESPTQSLRKTGEKRMNELKDESVEITQNKHQDKKKED